MSNGVGEIDARLRRIRRDATTLWKGPRRPGGLRRLLHRWCTTDRGEDYHQLSEEYVTAEELGCSRGLVGDAAAERAEALAGGLAFG